MIFARQSATLPGENLPFPFPRGGVLTIGTQALYATSIRVGRVFDSSDTLPGEKSSISQDPRDQHFLSLDVFPEIRFVSMQCIRHPQGRESGDRKNYSSLSD